MNIKLNYEESCRISTGEILKDDAFINIEYELSSDDNQFYSKGLSATFYGMFQIFIVQKDREIKVFTYPKKYKVFKKDFEYYSDGEILFTNSKLN